MYIVHRRSLYLYSSIVNHYNLNRFSLKFINDSATDKSFSEKRFSIKDIPKSALYLGFSGAVPFVSLAFASGILNVQFTSMIAIGQISYAACILTFLGGVHWGKEIATNQTSPSLKTLTTSIIPSLYAWSAFVLPHKFGLYYLSLGLISMATYDINDKSLPLWYRKLRIPLTILAASSVGVTGYNL